MKPVTTRARSIRLARTYFGFQGLVGVGWNVLAWHSPSVRSATLGDLNPALVLWPDLLLFSGASLLAAAMGRPRWAWVATGWSLMVTVLLTGYGLVTGQAGTGIALMWPAVFASLGAASLVTGERVPQKWFFVGPFALAQAAAATPEQHFRRSMRQLVVFWVAFFVAVAGAIAWAERRLNLAAPWLDQAWITVGGVVLTVAGSALGYTSMRVMSRSGLGTPLPSAHASLMVTTGPYAWVRNPMATAGALQTLGVGAILGSWAVWCGALLGGAFWHLVIRPVEEDDLAARFGSDYDTYRRDVALWVPRRLRG